jgi:hypothetical protein
MSSPSTVLSVLRSARREALFVAVVWILACVHTVGYSALFGYGQQGPPALILGIPAWVVWGVFAPWAVVTLITCWYAFFGMRDEDLGDDEPAFEGAEGAGHA